MACKCYRNNGFPSSGIPSFDWPADLYDAGTFDDNEVFWCARCNDAIPAATVGRLQRFEDAVEAMPSVGVDMKNHDRVHRSGHVERRARVLLRVDGSPYDVRFYYLYNGKPVRWVRL